MDHLECSMDMGSRKREYYRARGAAKKAFFKVENEFCEDLDEKDGREMYLG